MAEAAIIVDLLQRWRHRRMFAEVLRSTLAGLKAVHVAVEPVNEDAERDGLRQAALAATAEAALRARGLCVVDATELFADVPGTPVLHVDVMTVHLDEQYAYSVRLELWQAVRLVRTDGAQTLAITWSAPQLVGSVAASRVSDLCDVVREAADGFATECRAASDQAHLPPSSGR
jgi:hypothetical protein